jgi:hypothetical protein
MNEKLTRLISRKNGKKFVLMDDKSRFLDKK